MQKIDNTNNFIPSPNQGKNDFYGLGIAPKILDTLERLKFKVPMPIQRKAIPLAIQGKDIIGIAQTGTGKTHSFAIPIIQHLALGKGTALVLAPTRELAVQIDEAFQGLAKPFGMRTSCLIGGALMNPQIQALRRNPRVVIATPGRLMDHIWRSNILLDDIVVLVLDEADRMLDMGFIQDMKFMMSLMPKDRHTLFFSATMSRDVESLIKVFLRDPISISVKTGDTPKSVDQDIVKTRGRNKIDVLHDLLSGAEFKKVLVFGRTKHGVEKLSKILTERGFKAESIHGNKNLSKRRHALTLFKDNHIQVLVATDVAARGLDIIGVSHVINYDLPATYDDYVHRIGRTGRGSKKGKALTFVE